MGKLTRRTYMMGRTEAAAQRIDGMIKRWLATYGADNVAVADLLCDGFADSRRAALHYEDADGQEEQLHFAELRDLSASFADALGRLGVESGDRVATLLPKSPELLITLLAIWRAGAVHVPLFTALGTEAVGYRLADSGAKVIVSNPTHRAKIDRDSGARVMLVGGEASGDDVSFEEALRSATPVRAPASLSGEDSMIHLYTSGTEGNPKGVEVPVRALASFEAYMRFGLDLREDDVFWNVADPGWAYGLYYGVLGPLILGKSILWVNAPFDPEGVYAIMRKYGVTNLAAAPTAYRAMRAGVRQAGGTGGLRLRVASSAGEPLNPGVIEWAQHNLGVEIRDHYGQTELGMVINNHNDPALARPVRPGSMGQEMPGYWAAILDADGERKLGASQEGQLAIDAENSPLFWFRGYYQDPERTERRFSEDGHYYLTGDSASRDGDGYYFFSGRADDVIISAGYRIGPFEVESALVSHPAVAEAAVVGKPDEIRGEVVTSFVVLSAGHVPSKELANELQQHVKSTLAAHTYPREIRFLEELPKTPSGKIQRFLLRKEFKEGG